MSFFNSENTKRIEALELEMKKLHKEFKELELDFQIYYNKLKSVKNIKPVKEQNAEDVGMGEEATTYKNPVILPE